MEVIRGIRQLRARHHGCVLTIGNYDGIHLGHQAVLSRLRECGAALGLPSVVMTFEPTPMEFFCPEQAPARLSNLRESIQDISAQHIDRLLCVRFNQTFADLSPDAFTRELLVNKLGVAQILVGEDFRYGHERAGNVAHLRAQGEALGFTVAPMPTVKVDGERVSSTRVRQALAHGKLDETRALLGRSYRISGLVIKGAQLGRTLDVPTANLQLKRLPAPRFGVYAVQAELADGRCYPAAANLGVRPTVNGTHCLLEVHIMDFKRDLYGQRINVHFEHYLRPETRFADTQALRTQMLDDIKQARQLLAR